jgi:hypothetical protein
MKLEYLLIFILLISFCRTANASDNGVSLDKKSVMAVRISEPPKIDGYLDDEVWSTAPVAGDFIQYSPYSGRPASFATQVRVLYDDEAVYFAAIMYDPNPDSIFIHLGQRDSGKGLNADKFNIEISTFNDGINGETFSLSASGVQSDSKARQTSPDSWGRDDMSWDAVWYSRVRITEEGWVAEIKIPLSTLRFPRIEEQTWGINFWREIRRYREESSWSYVNREVGNNFSHLGEIKGLSNLVPPLRLSLTPYISGYYEKYNGEKPGRSFNGGLDIKYGINESFTFDATLIPDFGQVQSDDQILNLTPYETKFNERRPFFMEGTELFSRGDIFYSRRIGTRPKLYNQAAGQVGEGETLISNPQESALINASKLSGRTKGGLGIGIFNAMTKSMYARIEEISTGGVRHFKTEPFTNFSMLVLDQSLRNNSFVSFSNSNVWRKASRDDIYYTANVTATDFRFQNETRKYSVSGKGAISQKYYDESSADLGHSYELSGGKTGGIFRAEYQIKAISDTYDPNDMGYLRRNNEFQNSVTLSYNTHIPFWIIYTTRNSLAFSYNQLYAPRVFTGSAISYNSMFILRNYWSVRLNASYKPGGEDDYYEPRIAGRYYHRPRELSGTFTFDTDKSKIYYFNFRSSLANIWSDYDQSSFSTKIEQEVKLSTRMVLGLEIDYSKNRNDIGWVAFDQATDDIVFGKRDNTTFTTTIQSEYIFTADSYLTFRLRHYWSRADYDGSYFMLMENGRLSSLSYSGNPNRNYNAFNIDMVYNWRFAPGSEMTLVWKNAIYASDSLISYDYLVNLRNMFEFPVLNSLSLKILYYLDYQSLKKRG